MILNRNIYLKTINRNREDRTTAVQQRDIMLLPSDDLSCKPEPRATNPCNEPRASKELFCHDLNQSSQASSPFRDPLAQIKVSIYSKKFNKIGSDAFQL